MLSGYENWLYHFTFNVPLFGDSRKHLVEISQEVPLKTVLTLVSKENDVWNVYILGQEYLVDILKLPFEFLDSFLIEECLLIEFSSFQQSLALRILGYN